MEATRSRTRNPKATPLVLVFLIAAVVGLVVRAAIAAGSDSRPAIGGWPDDKNGDGIVSDAGNERIPELIRAVGDDGVEGYVRFEDLEGPQPSSPEQAVRMSGSDRVIPLYAEDGTTVIGTYTLSSGDPAPSSEPPAQATSAHRSS
jgi:hypothetical protein